MYNLTPSMPTYRSNHGCRIWNMNTIFESSECRKAALYWLDKLHTLLRKLILTGWGWDRERVYVNFLCFVFVQCFKPFAIVDVSSNWTPRWFTQSKHAKVYLFWSLDKPIYCWDNSMRAILISMLQMPKYKAIICKFWQN